MIPRDATLTRVGWQESAGRSGVETLWASNVRSSCGGGTLVTVWARNVREREGQRLGEGVALVDWAGRQTVLALTV